MEYLKRIKVIIDDYNGLDNKVTEETNLTADLGISSLAFFDVVCRIEDEFDIVIRDKDVSSLKTVGNIINYIQSNK